MMLFIKRLLKDAMLLGKRYPRITCITLVFLLLAGVGLTLITRSRQASCAYVPVLNEELLPNASLFTESGSVMPQGWGRRANGVELRGRSVGNGTVGFDYDGDGRSLQLIGIGNYVQTPAIAVRPGASYCFAGRALTDSDKRSATRLRAVFDWRNVSGTTLREDVTNWQPVLLWQPDKHPDDWSAIRAAFAAPPDAVLLVIRLQPASDDRVYLDAMHIRRTTADPQPTTGTQQTKPTIARDPSPVVVQPWPNAAQAAISFSFDWETAMGGLIHSRSLDDPNASQDPLIRALRMRQGVTTTLDLFRFYGIRATYYATGYNFLLGNTERRKFMGDPTFSWADHTKSGKWPNDVWKTVPWFSKDPYGTIQTDSAWYFGDLIPLLQHEQQDIQSHTFSHLDGGLASTEEWRFDLQTWREVAGARGVTMARSLAFPWSSSAGMSDASWDELEAAGITSVTRTKPNQPQYELVSPGDPHCKPVPGHEQILACPDFYLHSQETAAQAIRLIDHSIEVQGMIDLWAHTEEVTSVDQIAAWGQVVRYAAQQRDAGTLWIAPLAEIADWQQAIGEISIQESAVRSQEQGVALDFRVTNSSKRDMHGLTLMLPFKPGRVTVAGRTLNADSRLPTAIVLDVAAGQAVEVQAWPA